MRQYGVRDVEKLLRLPRSAIRALVEAGFVSPSRGPRRAWQFSFQDLIVLRTAQELWAARVPRRRITRSMKELRRHLPDAMPLSGLRICAEDDRVVVKEGAHRWQADSGQYLLAFEGDPAAGSLAVVAPRPPADDAREWLEKGMALEDEDAEAALRAYQRAVAADPKVLVLDDPLSALDVDTEALVEEALRHVLADTTALVVAHRPSTVALADRVALLERGRITAVGTHSELLRTSEHYRHVISSLEVEEARLRARQPQEATEVAR